MHGKTMKKNTVSVFSILISEKVACVRFESVVGLTIKSLLKCDNVWPDN